MIQDTLFKKNLVRNEFKGLKPSVVVILWIALLVIGLFLFTNEVLSATIFEENFDNYNLGNLTGQGNWSGDVEYQVVDDEVIAGRSVNFSSIFIKEIQKTGNNVEIGNLQYSVRFGSGCYSDHRINLRNENGDTSIQVGIYCLGEDWWFKADTHIGEHYIVAELIPDTWYLVKLKWDSTTDTYKANFNDTGWSGDLIFLQNANYLNRLDLIGGGINIWYDEIGEIECDLGNCGACETYDTCIGVGCYWYYSIYLQEWYCVEPFEPEPEDCGSFYQCQYCMTQETCEAEWCVWEDRGLGEKCYMEEPEIPPEEIEWEIPDLENCEGLGTIETWLCEIKNFVAGIFMPSQEKINSLYQTIGAIKEKVPFNYAESLNGFFSDVEESLNEEKGIPIKILGQESNVSFAFWEETTTIGGVGETFKNILFDFTSFIILMGWFVWLVSWIRRFF